MIPHYGTAIRVVILSLLIQAQAQSEPFTNLDFELGRFRGDFPTTDTAEVLIPGWTLMFDNQVVNFMRAGLPAAGSPTAWLADRRFIDGNVIQGRFSLALEPGCSSPSEPHHWAHYGLSQSGDVPAGSQALRFQGKWGVFSVRIDGISLDLVDESPTDLWYAADVRQFAGQRVLLEFLTTEGSPGTGSRAHVLDTIEFSPNPVIPEPSPVAIAVCGMGVFLLVHGRRGRRT